MRAWRLLLVNVSPGATSEFVVEPVPDLRVEAIAERLVDLGEERHRIAVVVQNRLRAPDRGAVPALLDVKLVRIDLDRPVLVVNVDRDLLAFDEQVVLAEHERQERWHVVLPREDDLADPAARSSRPCAAGGYPVGALAPNREFGEASGAARSRLTCRSAVVLGMLRSA